MPSLKFTRDRRGYENTFLVETARRRGREQARVLYRFRSPPQVKVGRAAIDEDAIRALEDAYPGIAFDWTRILEARPPDAEPAADDPGRRARPRPGRDRETRRESRPERPAQARPAVDPEPRREPFLQPPPTVGPAVPAMPADAAPFEVLPPSAAIVESVDLGLEPAAPEGADFESDEPSPPPAHASEPSAAARILGSEGLLRLRARYAEVCARIGAGRRPCEAGVAPHAGRGPQP